MSSEDNRPNFKSTEALPPSETGGNSSRFEDIKAQEQQEQYNKHYQRMLSLLNEGLLDFKLIAKETGLKERKVRDTLLSRLTSSDMIQLFGHKEGICYICGTRMRGNFTQEPLCLLCIETIGSKVKELYPPEVKAAAPAPSREISTTETPAAISSIETVPKEEFEAILNEVHRYRDKYGPMDSPPPEDTPDSSMQDMDLEAENTKPPEAKIPSADAFEILHIEEGTDDSEETLSQDPKANQSSPSEPIRHFGFQRLKSRN